MNYYERHLGDYARDAGHLTMLEHGAYTLLLDRYYTTEQGIPADQAHRVCRARTRDEKEAVDTVLAEFFTLIDGRWVNGRASREVTKMQAKVKAAQENGKRGGRPKRTEEEPGGNPPGYESVTQIKALQSPVTSTHSVSEIPHGGAAKRGTRLPADWAPGETGVAFASQQGLSGPRVEAELARFRDHWAAKTGADASKADWQATWRNWVRKAVEFGPGRNGSGSGDDPFAGAH